MTPELIPQFILEQERQGHSHGRLAAAALFVDLSGFSAVTSALMSHGSEAAELMANIMEAIFAPLVDAVYKQDGFITTFAGDAFTALFLPLTNSEQSLTDDDREWACRRALAAAVGIRDHLITHPTHETPYGRFPFAARLGLGVGEVAWGILRPDEKTDVSQSEVSAAYYFNGSAIDEAVQAEAQGQSGFIVLSPAVFQAVKSQVKSLPVGDAGCVRLLAVSGELPAPSALSDPADVQSQRAFIPATVWERSGQGDFRQVVSVFVSLMGIDSPEQLAYFMTSLFELQAQYGGYLNRVDFGDKGCNLLLFWGTPTGHENDLERALAFLLALPTLTPAAFRAGVTYRSMYTGLAGSAHRAEFTCYGEGVNLAARLMMAAPWNDIWLEETAARRAGRVFVLESQGDHLFKGFAKPVTVQTLIERRAAGEESLFQGEMVGREAERARLLAFLQPLLGEQPDGWAGILAIIGEAGLGKSRLVYEATIDPAIDQKAQIFTGQTDQILRQPFNPFRYWLRRYFEQSAAQSEARNKRTFNHRLDRLITAVTDEALEKELNRLRSVLGALVDLYWENSLYAELDPQSRHENSLIAFQKLLYAECLRRPVLFILEDVQWLDEASREVLTELTRNLTSAPFALFATARPTPAEEWPLAGLPHETLTLESLTPELLEKLATAVLGDPASPDLSRLLVERAEGNPFFAEQILRYLQESATIHEQGGQWELAADTGVAPLPDDLRLLFIARLDRLAVEVKEVVQTAAVLGREFETQVLTYMLRDELLTTNYLSQAESEAIWSALSQIRYIFKHGLLRDAAYEMQLVARRRELHRVAAEALETLYVDDLTPHYAEIAYHYETAYQQGMVEVKEQAYHYLRLAGKEAAARYENLAAIDALSRALALTDDQGEQIELLLAREEVYHLLGERAAQTADLEKLSHLAQAWRRPAEEAAVALRRAYYAQATSDYEAAKTAAREAARLAQAAGDAALESEARSAWGDACQGQSDYNDARLHYQDALLLAQAAVNTRQEVAALIGLGVIATTQSDYPAAQSCLEQALSLVTERRQQAVIRHSLGNIYGEMGDYTAAGNYYEQAITLCRAIGDRSGEMGLINNLAIIVEKQGSYDEAIAYYEQYLAACRAIGDRQGEGLALCNLGDSTEMRGNYDDARRYYESALTIYRAIGDRENEAWGLINLAHVVGTLGDYDRAQNYSKEGLTISQEIGDRYTEGFALGILGFVLYQQGDYQNAQSYCEQALAVGREIGSQTNEEYSLTLLGDVLIALNNWPAATTILQEALAVCKEVGSPMSLMETDGALARLYLAQGEIEQAQKHSAPLFDYLAQGHALAGATRPFHLYLTGYQVQRAAGDGRAHSVLEQAYKELQARAGRIADEATRRSFLENVPWNRQIVEIWRQEQSGAAPTTASLETADQPTADLPAAAQSESRKVTPVNDTAAAGQEAMPVTVNISLPDESTGEAVAEVAPQFSPAPAKGPAGRQAPIVLNIYGGTFSGTFTVNIYYGSDQEDKPQEADQ